MFPADPTVVGTLTRPDQLFDRLPSLWRNQLADRELLRTHLWATLQLHGDAVLRGLEVATSVSIQTLQPFVARQWRLIRLLESELEGGANVVRYGSGRVYGDGTLYGQISEASYAWTLPGEIREVGLLLDNPIAPTRIYDVSNSRFDPDTGVLTFIHNPFDHLVVEPVYDAAGLQIDRQVTLFARNVAEDHGTPQLRYGAVLGLTGRSSRPYCQIMTHLWDMLVGGPSIGAFTRGLLAAAGLPWTVGDETVERVEVDDQGLAIVTDSRVYRFHAAATALVAVGDLLTVGQPLVDTVRVYDLATGTPPPALPGVVLSGIAFEDADIVWDLLQGNAIVVVLKPEHFLAQERFLPRAMDLLPAGTLLLVQTALQPTSDDLNSDPTLDTVAVSAEAVLIDDSTPTTLLDDNPFVMVS